MLDATLLPYVLLLLVAGIPAITMGARRSDFAWPIAWVIFVLFIGLRHRIGGDWATYVAKTSLMGRLPLEEAIWVQDPLFSILSRLSFELGFGVYGTNLVGAMIFCTGLFQFCDRQSNRWLALVAATPFLVVASVMSASRQGIAIGVVLIVLARWKELSLSKRAAGFLVAGLFHASAFILLLLVTADLKLSLFRKVIISSLIAVATIWLMSRTNTGLSQYTEIYVLNQSNRAPGAFSHLLLNLIPAMGILVSWKWWARRVPDWEVIRSLCYVAIALAILVPFFSQAASRMSLYLFPVSIVFLAWLPRVLPNESGRTLMRLLSVTSMAFVLIVWIGFSNQSQFYRPYQNVLTTSVEELDLPR